MEFLREKGLGLAVLAFCVAGMVITFNNMDCFTRIIAIVLPFTALAKR